MEFIYGGRIYYLRIAQSKHLRPADSQRIKPRNARPALAARIGIVQPVVVNEIVAGNLTQASVGIDAPAALVVPHGFRIGGRSKEIRADIRLGNVLAAD